MDKREINGEEWGRIMLGKDKSNPCYRKKVEGKWVSVPRNEVPADIERVFATQVATIERPDVTVPEEKVDIAEPVVNDFGFSGEDADTTELPPENPLETCTLKELVEALYDRFGIYTSYLQREPQQTDIHPITCNMMSNFTLGQARNQYLVARRSGANWNGDVMKSVLSTREQPHFDFAKHFDEHPEHFDRPALEEERNLTMAEYRELRKKEKPIMATEHGRRGDGTDEDELYAEPPINGRQIIRPYGTSPSAQRRLDARRRERGEYGY